MKTFLQKTLVIAMLALWFEPSIILAQGIDINSGGNITVSGGATIEINNGSFVNDGIFTKGAETVIFSGSTAGTISGGSNTTVNNLEITNTGGVATQVGLLTTNNLSIAAACKFTIDPIKQVTVNGTLNNAAGNGGLIIKSTASGTGSLKHNTAGVQGTVERYIDAAIWNTWDDGWHFVSSPVSGQAITGVFTVIPANEYDFYAWSEKYNNWINFKNNITPLFTDSDVNGSSLFVLGKGYMAAYKTADTKVFSGALNVSDVTISGLTVTGTTQSNRSWHLLGNPFTSALTWYTGWPQSNIGGVANIWNEAGKSYTPVSANGIIPAGNGFMVQANLNGASLTIPAANRVHSAQAWYKRSDYPVIQLFAHNLDNASFQESQVRLNPESTTGFDFEYDGNFLPGYAPSFYSVMEGENLMVNSIPEFTAETVIPFRFVKNEGTNFTIEAKGIESLNSNDILFLKDKKLGIDYNMSANNIYSFTSLTGDDAARFELHLGSYTGINETASGYGFNIYAADGKLNIQSPQQSGGKVEVFDMAGRIIAAGRVNPGANTQIDIHCKTGVYIVRVLTGEGISNTKILVR